MKRTILTLLTVVMIPAFAWSAKVKVWHHHSGSHHERAVFKQTVLTSEGALQLARQLKPLPGIEAAHVWAVVEDNAGNLLVATGNEGKLYRVASDGKVSVAFQSADSQILSLAAAPDGTVYAGTGPSGKIIRISSDGTAKVFHETTESYIWCLAFDAKSETLFAGTGPRGRILKVTKDGKAEVFYAAKPEHILCLAAAADGQLYAGTNKVGLVYRIDAKGKGFVVYDAPQTEIKTLLVTPDAVFAGTSAPASRGGSSITVQTAEGRSTAAAHTVVPAFAASVDLRREPANEKTAAGSSPAGSGGSPASGSNSSAPAASPPATGENSVYRIGADGTVREVFRQKGMILSLLPRDHRLLIATGGEGQLFELHTATKERTELARLDHSQIHCLFQRRDGSIILGAGDPGKLYVLKDDFVAQGTVVSEVLDARSLSRWGALRWKAETPAGTQVSIAVRSGNVAEPDETWSDWSAEQSDGPNAAIASPPARFLQYRATLVSNDPKVTPSVQGISLRYMTTNIAPEVTSIEVPDLDAVTLETPKKLKLRWTAADANEDELTYSLFYRKEAWQNWVELETDLDKREFEWDTTTTPAGVYQLKVVASDRKDNAEEQALTGVRISSAFIIDHVPPAVSVKVVGFEGDQAVLEATVTDGLTRLVSASFSVDSRKWINVFPTDGLFDSKQETLRFKTNALKPGTHVLVLRVSEAAGNTGASDVVFTMK